MRAKPKTKTKPKASTGNASGMPLPKMDGTGTVITSGGVPAKTPAERHAYHTALFLDRGMSKAEAKRLADEVIARDGFTL